MVTAFSVGDDYVDFEPDKLGRDLGVPLAASLRPAIFDGNGAALDPAELAQPLEKSGLWAEGVVGLRIRRSAASPPAASALLAATQPRRRAP
jgi:hypothetical protein